MKKLIFGLAFLGAMSLSGVSVNAQGMGGPGGGEDEKRWQQLHCTDGTGGTYEICFYTGDGNTCDTHGAKTRNC